MSPKRWILLLIFYTSYLMLGASIYYHIEHGEEKQKRAEQLRERIEMHDYLMDQLAEKNKTTKEDILINISDYCGKPVTDYNTDEFEIPYTWTFYHSFFFSFTVCSTVGYGNISPTTDLGRAIMIVYSVIGIPVNGILFAGLGEFFGKTFEAIYRRYKKYKLSNDVRYVPPQLGLITIVAIALVPGITLFLLIPAWVFSYFEGWPYFLAFYYSYVTTTTIGFGDYVPTFQADQPRKFGGWFVVYEIFIIFWFIFSLGYLVMIMTFITRGLQSKKLLRLEQQLSTNIKATQNRIWNGVTKDVGYLRRVLNELYILRVKPVYTEPCYAQLQHRSISCPELTMYRVDPPPEISRKRAFSECYEAMENRADGTPFPIIHASSDTELDKFDRTKSFENAEAFRQTTELLSKVVNALATVKPPQEEQTTIGSADMYGGYHGFSDSQILASEWSFPSANDIRVPKQRGRACSDFNINPKYPVRRLTVPQQNEWTWSGDNLQIQEAINNRFKQSDRQNLYRSSFGLPPAPEDYMVHLEDGEIRKSRAKKFSIPDGFRKLFPFKKRPSQDFAANDATVVGSGGTSNHRKFSIMSVPETQQYRAPPADYYSTITANGNTAYQLQNGKPAANGNYPSDGSISSKLSSVAQNGGNMTSDSLQTTLNANGALTPYQRNVGIMPKKRRESIFTQNPAISTRRGSMYPPSNVAALTQRRGSAAQSVAGLPPRRGSLFPGGNVRSPSNARRPSLFSVSSQNDLDVLENTTIADLIRALEVVHTQAAMDETAVPPQTSEYSEMGGIFGSDPKKRKVGNARSDLEPPQLPPLLSLFGGDNTKALTTTAANRLYARRATIVGTPLTGGNLSNLNRAAQAQVPGNVLTRRRKSSVVQIVDPPPSYSERDVAAIAPQVQTAGTSAGASAMSKFKRRFSIRPTTLQIPPGKAPPASVSTSAAAAATVAPTQPMAAVAATTNTTSASQTALQRRLSLRPSPLARELNITTQPSDNSGTNAGPVSPTATATTSATRLLPPRPSNTTSSSHSPLSRIVQISQAQRKSSVPEGVALERTKQPDAT